MIQQTLNFVDEADRDFARSTPPIDWPDTLLIECRARRIGCSVSSLRLMRSYDLARELAEEVALQSLGPGNESIKAHRPDWNLIDQQARRESRERMEDFNEWWQMKRSADSQGKPRETARSRKR